MKTEVINGKSINGFQINWSTDDLINKIGKRYSKKDLSECYLIKYKNFRFWINKKTNKIYQIGVTGDYSGKFLNKIGIGSTLEDVKKYVGEWQEDLDVYIIPKYEGVCFELAENDIEEEWIEDKMPINAIYVYNPKDEIWQIK